MKLWQDDNQKFLCHPLFVPVLLFMVVLAFYYPTLSSGIHTIDDPGIVDLYGSSPPLSQVLLPGGGYYYRPLLEVTFWLDNRLWGMDSTVMHLENVLLHCANTLLVFVLARRVSTGVAGEFPFVPILAALLFALHPVNVEAVSWIAGRSDLLLALFVLSACFFWLGWLDEPTWVNCVSALMLFGTALLVKETALTAGVVAFLLALMCPGNASPRQRAAVLAVMAAPGLLLIAFSLISLTGTSGLGKFMSITNLRVGQGVWEILVGFGFYTRKMVIPAPLNFAITHVSPAYGLIAVVLLPALCFLLLRRRLNGVLFASAALMLLPAVMVAVKQITWTPYAERYLYLPSAFCVLGVSVSLPKVRLPLRRAVFAITLISLTGFSILSMGRILLWRDKLGFVQDAIAKSPQFGSLYNQLGGILLQQEKLDAAAEAFATADRLNKRESVRLLIKANMMVVQLAKGDYSGVRTQFFTIFSAKGEAPADFLELLLKADSRRMASLSGECRMELVKDQLETLEFLNQKRYDPYWLYRSGQLSLLAGDRPKAADFFSRSYRAAPTDAHYRNAARNYLQQLENTR